MISVNVVFGYTCILLLLSVSKLYSVYEKVNNV